MSEHPSPCHDRTTGAGEADSLAAYSPHYYEYRRPAEAPTEAMKRNHLPCSSNSAQVLERHGKAVELVCPTLGIDQQCMPASQQSSCPDGDSVCHLTPSDTAM